MCMYTHTHTHTHTHKHIVEIEIKSQVTVTLAVACSLISDCHLALLSLCSTKLFLGILTSHLFYKGITNTNVFHFFLLL